MKRFRSILLLSIAVVTSATFAQKQLPAVQKDTLARYGTIVVTAADFLERFELMPWPLKDNRARIELTKQEFLQSLVAEKMLALEAQRLGMGQDTASQEMLYSLQRMFTRDEVYKRDVLSKIRITADEIKEGMRRYASELRVIVYGLVSKKEGDILLKKLAISKNKEKTFETYRDSLYTPLDTLTVNFGGLDVKAEDAAYALKVGELSKPINTMPNSGWRMLKLIDKYTNEKYAKQSLPDQITTVKKIISQRHEDSIAVRVFSQYLSPQKAEADPALFKELADSVYSILRSDSAGHKAKNVYMLYQADLERLEQHFGDRGAMKFITSESGNLTLGAVINGLKYNQVVFPSLREHVVQIVLNNNIKTVVQNEIIAREGMKRNYQQSENVRHDVGVWMDNRRGRLLMKAVIDTVTVNDAEIEEYYAMHAAEFGANVEVKVREILVDSGKTALDLRRRLDAGEDFGLLASKYSKRKAWARQGGLSELFPVSKYPEIGGYAAGSEPGRIIGPLKIPEGYTIFTLVERRIQDDSVRKNFAAVKQTIEKKLLDEKKQQTLNRYIAALGRKFNVSFDYEKLKRVQTTTTSMVTWRTIGFGGRILAVPMASPQTQWMREMPQQKSVNQ
ncbi:MAG: peptidyl-prolyl cis-trans isomerase [Acidobacteriota bacterium]